MNNKGSSLEIWWQVLHRAGDGWKGWIPGGYAKSFKKQNKQTNIKEVELSEESCDSFVLN